MDDWVTWWQSYWITESLSAQLWTPTDTYWHLLTLTDTYWHILTLTDTYSPIITLRTTFWVLILCTWAKWPHFFLLKKAKPISARILRALKNVDDCQSIKQVKNIEFEHLLMSTEWNKLKTSQYYVQNHQNFDPVFGFC